MINDKPLLFYIINKLKQAGVNEIILNVHHHAEQITNYLKENNGNVTKIAEKAQMTRRNLHRLLNKHSLDPSSWRTKM